MQNKTKETKEKPPKTKELRDEMRTKMIGYLDNIDLLDYLIKFEKKTEKQGIGFKSSLEMLIHGYNTGVYNFEIEKVVVPRLPKSKTETTEKE